MSSSGSSASSITCAPRLRALSARAPRRGRGARDNLALHRLENLPRDGFPSRADPPQYSPRPAPGARARARVTRGRGARRGRGACSWAGGYHTRTACPLKTRCSVVAAARAARECPRSSGHACRTPPLAPCSLLRDRSRRLLPFPERLSWRFFLLLSLLDFLDLDRCPCGTPAPHQSTQPSSGGEHSDSELGRPLAAAPPSFAAVARRRNCSTTSRTTMTTRCTHTHNPTHTRQV